MLVLNDKSTYCVITGASRGLGSEISLAIARKLHPESTLVLAARNHDELDALKSRILDEHPALTVTLVQVDLSLVDQVESNLERILDGNATHKRAIMIHNAGTLGPIDKYIRELPPSGELQTYFDLNLTSMIRLTTRFLTVFKHSQRFIIQISSLFAVMPMSSMSLYCTGKAARDMFIKCTAQEFPEVRCLNYAPGPLKTDMGRRCRMDVVDEETLRLINGSAPLDSAQSAAVLMEVLTKDEYTSGAHVDIYDVLTKE